MILRPDVVIFSDGSWREGWEVCLSGGVIEEVRPWSKAERDETGMALSVAFVNAHSHLEYYDLKNRWLGVDYWNFIREITEIKPTRRFDEVLKNAKLGAKKNIETGVSVIGEWSDWEVSAKAVCEAGLDGVIFQELITVLEHDELEQKLENVKQKARAQSKECGLPVYIAPHTPYTVHIDKILECVESQSFCSIHVAEHENENQFLKSNSGAIAEFIKNNNVNFPTFGKSFIQFLNENSKSVNHLQLVHCCDVDMEDIEIISAQGWSVVHCPRSNLHLGCPNAPIAEMLEKGITVGLGMDSAASSGDIDIFAEMRAATTVAMNRLAPLKDEQIWQMATIGGAKSLGLERKWDIGAGNNPDLILIDISNMSSLGDLISYGSASRVKKLIQNKPTLQNAESVVSTES